MNNYKTKVNSEVESKEVQELFESLGYEKGMCSLGNYPAVIVTTQDWATGNYCSTRALGLDIPAHDNYTEITLPELRAMVKPKMKEYLDAKRNCEFVLSTEKDDGFIEIPEGMNFAYKDEFNIHFTKLEMGYRDSVLVWKREQDEPFLTPECTLNDQYAEIEQIRQHSHYKKDVSNLEFVDVYRVLKLFDVTDPCLQHSIKKLLCSGQRGAKSSDQDVQEAIDSLVRFQQMRIEDTLD